MHVNWKLVSFTVFHTEAGNQCSIVIGEYAWSFASGARLPERSERYAVLMTCVQAKRQCTEAGRWRGSRPKQVGQSPVQTGPWVC